MLDSSKMKEFADDNSKFYENDKVLQKGKKHCGKRRNCSLRVISPFPTVFSKDLFCRHVKTRACFARNEQFLLFPKCFQKTCPADTYKPGLVWAGLNASAKDIDPDRNGFTVGNNYACLTISLSHDIYRICHELTVEIKFY